MEFVEKDNIRLPKMGLGTFLMSEDILEKVIPESLRIGYTLFDTAHRYQNEKPLGKILKSYEHYNPVIETKVHPVQLLGNLRYLRLNRHNIRSTYRQACRNLQVDYIDVFMIHGVFNGYERHLARLLEIKDEIKAGLVGICNINIQQLRSFQSSFGKLPDIVQIEIHPYHNNKELVDFCKANSVLIQARSPFAHGDAMEQWYKEDVLIKIAKRYNATIPQIILRWITQQDIIAIHRSTNMYHLQENMDSFELKLTDEEISMIDSLNKDLSFGFISAVKSIHNK